MPARDGTGPAGMGPMTGRQMGRCVGTEQFAGRGAGRGFGYGAGFGMGLGRRMGRRFTGGPVDLSDDAVKLELERAEERVRLLRSRLAREE
jgi:hypothetical protein